MLRQELSESNEIGRFVRFDFNSSSEYLVQCCAFIEPRDSPQVKLAKQRQSKYYDYVIALTELSPKEFEALCGGLLELFGVIDPQVTSYSADEGIDFFGRLKLDKFMFSEEIYPNIQKQLSVLMIGQAKHYIKGQSSTFEIRELVGSVELAKGGAYGAVKEKYENLRIKVCDPVFYLFFTTGRFSLNSWRLISNSGVVAMDGDMVATFLAQKSIGIDDDGAFQLSAFKDWVTNYFK